MSADADMLEIQPTEDRWAETIQFGRYSVVPNRRQFLVDGRPSEMGARAFDLLMALIRARGNVVSKDEMLGAAWPETHVSEVNLRVHIGAIRKAFGDDRDLVKTVPGRGYLLAALGSSRTTEGCSIAVEPESDGRETKRNAENKTNLPQPLTALVGRENELAELERVVTEARLVTLVGSGGIGKTRLAIDLGWCLAWRLSGAVRLINLAPILDPAVIVSTTATALGMQLQATEPTIASLVAMIGADRQLLIFDNCEHLVEPVGVLIGELLARAPNLSVIATSQVTLGIQGERVYRVAPLAVPPDAASDVAGFDAVTLFVSRVRAADGRFELDAHNVASVGEICRRLDGVPLALEMAAARLPMLGVEALCAGLDARLKMLRTRPNGYEVRYSTLRAMAEWSHGLLDDEEKGVFRRLGIFAGSFALEAVIAVSGLDGSDQWDTVDTLGRLIDKSLVSIEGSEPPSYRLHETLRLFAMEQLDASGEREAIAERHARHFAELLGQADDAWDSTPDRAWIATYRPVIGDARAALNWALASPSQTELAAALAGGAGRLLWAFSLMREGRRYAEQALPLVDQGISPKASARLLRYAAGIFQEDIARSLELAKRSADLFLQTGDRLGWATVMAFIGMRLAQLGRFDEAREALSVAREELSGSNRHRPEVSAVMHVGVVAALTKDHAEAKRCFLSALEMARKWNLLGSQSALLANLAELEFNMGSVDGAIERAREQVALLGVNERHAGWILGQLSTYLAIRGDKAEARDHAEHALSFVRELDGAAVRHCLHVWALLGALDGAYEDAARLIGFIDESFTSSGEHRQFTHQLIDERLTGLLEASLTNAEIRMLAAEGARWSDAEAVEFTYRRLIGIT